MNTKKLKIKASEVAEALGWNYTTAFSIKSRKSPKDKDEKFNGLTNVLRVKEGGLQKYYYGSDKTMESAQKTLKQVQDKGFRNAFIVTFNGEEPM